MSDSMMSVPRARAEQLDPEDMREVLREYRQLCVQVTGAHGGTIVRYIGDGVLACFGFPVAHEDVGPNSVSFASARSELTLSLSALLRYVHSVYCYQSDVGRTGFDLVLLFADTAP
jgi:class 3 adenylate cyclase